jgi:hypothetical protein
LLLSIFSRKETDLRTFAELNIPVLVFVKADYRSDELKRSFPDSKSFSIVWIKRKSWGPELVKTKLVDSD